jgi:hypothetical protein
MRFRQNRFYCPSSEPFWEWERLSGQDTDGVLTSKLLERHWYLVDWR